MEADSSRTILVSFELIILVVLYAFFTTSALVVTRSKARKVRELLATRVLFARRARMILRRSRFFLVTSHIGSFLTVLFAGFFVMKIASSTEALQFVAEFTDRSRVRLALAVLFSISLVSILMLFTAQVARSMAYSRPERTLCRISIPLIVAGVLFGPITLVLDRVVARVMSRLGFKVPDERERIASAEDISELVELSSEAGEMEEDESDMIKGVISATETMVREVMTPRKDVVSVEIDTPLDQIIETFMESGLSRVLVTGEDLDDVKGILIAKDLMPLLNGGDRDFAMASFLREAKMISGGLYVDELLRQMRDEAQHFAVVLDEHGGVDGVVTIEDLIEEIVGEIFDEYDSPDEEQELRSTVNGEMLVDAGMLVDDLNETMNLALPEGEYDTVAGFVIGLMERIPVQGESVVYEGIEISVEEVEQNRITLLKIKPGDRSSHSSMLEGSQGSSAAQSAGTGREE